MPEYLAPGVYVEEVSFRARTIEGVDTTTAGFIGPCRYGPVAGAPVLLDSLSAFVDRYGDAQPLRFGAGGNAVAVTDLYHAVASFFAQGGRRLFVSRVYRPVDGGPPPDLAAAFPPAGAVDGHARLRVGATPGFRVVARHPGRLGNLQLQFGVRLGANRLQAGSPELVDGDVVWISSAAVRLPAPATGNTPPTAARGLRELPLYVAHRDAAGAWTFTGSLAPAGAPPGAIRFALADFGLNAAPGSGDLLSPVSLSLDVQTAEGRALATWQDLSPDPARPADAAQPGLLASFALTLPESLPAAEGAMRLVALLNGSAPGQDLLQDGIDLLAALQSLGMSLQITPAEWAASGQQELVALRRKFEQGLLAVGLLTGGHDGLLPDEAAYAGRPAADGVAPRGLGQLGAVDGIATVAAPGLGRTGRYTPSELLAINRQLVAHAEGRRGCMALIDPPEGVLPGEVVSWRGAFDTSHAALYYPWLQIADPAGGPPLTLPPSGPLAGIYARNDQAVGVHKSPANQVLRGILGFERVLTLRDQELLNPAGINGLRFFEGRGNLVWGARTLSADPEWKYVQVRRYVDFLFRSIDLGTQWAVFEPNGEALWSNVRRCVQDFLLTQWQSGALLGTKPEQAYFVQCDRTTMSPDDLAHGRLRLLIGVALLKPAEFVVVRVGQQVAVA